MTSGFITHPLCVQHEMGAQHPERPERLAAIEKQLIAGGLWDFLEHLTARPATAEELARVHPTAYIERLQALAPARGHAQLDPDTAMNVATWDAAHVAAGAVIQATEWVVEGRLDNAFCSVRPPGHHAEPDRPCGFCFFNNVACGVAHALSQLGMTRVAVADFDVHHGNGTEAMFRGDPRVLVCSSFQHPFYPYTPLNQEDDNIICTPLPAGAGSDEFRQAISEQWLPALAAFEPEMIFISAGFDAHRDDPLANLHLVEEDYTWITTKLLRQANRSAGGRIVSSLEGGYNLPALGRSVAAHIRVLAGI